MRDANRGYLFMHMTAEAGGPECMPSSQHTHARTPCTHMCAHHANTHARMDTHAPPENTRENAHFSVEACDSPHAERYSLVVHCLTAALALRQGSREAIVRIAASKPFIRFGDKLLASLDAAQTVVLPSPGKQTLPVTPLRSWTSVSPGS